MTGGKASRDKGNRRERELVRRHIDMGVHAERVPLSGAAGGDFSGDARVYAFGVNEWPLNGEVKARANGAGFTQVSKWLGTNDVLFLVKDRAEPIVALSWDAWTRLLHAVDRLP